MRISKPLLILISFIQGLCAFAQSPWIDESYRKTLFNPEEYYVSYHHLINERNNLDECVAQTILGVQSMLANSIFSEVSSTTKSTVEAINNNGNYTENESFFNEFSSAASARLVNVNVEHFYDKPTNTVHAIAYVKKQDLSKFCEDKITSNLASLDGKLQSIENLIGTGHKNEAKTIVGEAISSLNSYPIYLAQLIAIGQSKLNTSELSSKYELISRDLLRFKSDLEHSISIYIKASNTSPIIKSETLANKCRGLLSDKGCNFVTSSDNADYAVVIDYSTRTSSNTDDMWFAFSDVNLTVTRKRDGIVMYEDALSIKGGGGTEEKAHRKAIDLSPKQICDKILTCIQQ